MLVVKGLPSQLSTFSKYWLSTGQLMEVSKSGGVLYFVRLHVTFICFLDDIDM